VIDDVKLDLHIGGKPCGDGRAPDKIEIVEGRKGRGGLYNETL
jgi:hypothetical protein